MNRRCYIKKETFRFRRFCRRAYAAFCSLHREVTIGHVASYITDRQLRKSACADSMLSPLSSHDDMPECCEVDWEEPLAPVILSISSFVGLSLETHRCGCSNFFFILCHLFGS